MSATTTLLTVIAVGCSIWDADVCMYGWIFQKQMRSCDGLVEQEWVLAHWIATDRHKAMCRNKDKIILKGSRILVSSCKSVNGC